MAMTAGSNAGQSYSEINMTPLIDVMLVLLIIFIITIPSQTHAVKIDNPSHNPPPLYASEVIDLAIDFDGTLLWNKTPVDRATMQSYISRRRPRVCSPKCTSRSTNSPGTKLWRKPWRICSIAA